MRVMLHTSLETLMGTPRSGDLLVFKAVPTTRIQRIHPSVVPWPAE